MTKFWLRIATAFVTALGAVAWAAPMNSTTRSVIPSAVQQIISIDYSTVRQSPPAMTLKAQVLPQNVKEFENALKSIGVDPERDVDVLTLASLRDSNGSLSMVGVASGSFSTRSLHKAKSVKYNDHDLYPLSGTMMMTVVDENTLLLGGDSGLRAALGVRDGHGPNIDSNKGISELVKSAEKAPVWSAIDQHGTQEMMVSALGNSGDVVDFASLKDKVINSRYAMDFKDGVTFELRVYMADYTSRSLLHQLFKAGVLYKKVTSNSEQQAALDNVRVVSDDIEEDGDRAYLGLRFKADPKQFQTLLRSRCFAALSSEREELSGITSENAERPPTSE